MCSERPQLDILIPSVVERSALLETLLQKFAELTANYNDVGYSVMVDNKQIPVGEKRQRMLENSTAEYVVFFDDDDWPADNYVSSIYSALRSNPDSVGFLFRQVEAGQRSLTFKVSNQYEGWHEQKDGYDFVRPPFHLTPVKREIALQIGYPFQRIAEDYDYSMRLKSSGLIHSEIFINEYLYTIRYKRESIISKYGLEPERVV